MTLPTTRLHAASTALPPGVIRPRGWLERQLRLQAENITGQLEEIWPDVGADSGWLGGTGRAGSAARTTSTGSCRSRTPSATSR